jgi:hypothetical protein
MQQIPPPELPWHSPEAPARPTVIPMLPTRVQQPGRRAPLPDAVAVRRCAVPDTAPPFDDEIPSVTGQNVVDTAVHDGNGAVTPAAAYPPGQGQAKPAQREPDAADTQLTEPAQREPDAADPELAEADEPSAARSAGAGSSPRHPGPAADWPSQFAQVLAETLAGSRPARQLTPWTTEQARKRIRQLGPMLATDQRPKVRRIMTSAPAANVLEMTAVVRFGPRVRVLALRLEREQARAYRQGGSRWCCTAIESA